MNKLLVGLVAWTAIAVPSAHYFVCKYKRNCKEKVEAVDNSAATELAPIPRTKDLSFVVEDAPILENREQFGFRTGNATPELTDDNKMFLTEIAKYLKENPKNKITLSGGYMDSEKDITVGMLDNIGVARAAAVKDLLVAKGIEKDRISITNRKVDDLTKPLTFTGIKEKAPEEYDLAEAKYTFTNMTFSDINFAYKSAIFNSSKAFDNYSDSVKTYFDENADKILVIIGHTDNIGSDSYNIDLGKRRANNVKKYITDKFKIKANRIQTASKGKSKPIVKNDTDENRAKNRRVNVQIRDK